MKITDVKVFPVDEDKLKAYATITFDNCFIVRDLKVISGNKGYFIAMPSKKRKDGTFRDVAHPLNSETRQMIEDAVLEVYEEENKIEAVVEAVVEAAAPAFDTSDFSAGEAPPAVDPPLTDEAVTDEAVTGEAEADEDMVVLDEAEPDASELEDSEPSVSSAEEAGFGEESQSIAEEAPETGFGEESPSSEEEAPESEESTKSAEENPTIEPTDDPEKAFGYEE